MCRPVSFQPSDVKQPRDADGHILLDDTDFTVTYAVGISRCHHIEITEH